MSARAAVKAAQAVLGTYDHRVLVDGVWGPRSEGAFIAAPESVQRGAINAARGLGYTLADLRQTRGRSWQAEGFNVMLNTARAAGLEGISLLNLMATVVGETKAANVAERTYTLDRAKAVFGRRRLGALYNAHSASGIAIFNQVYRGVNGNVELGDGYKYRGRGYIQLTGRDNYVAFRDASGVDVVSNPESITQSNSLAAQIAVWFWKTYVVSRGAADDLEAATRIVRGSGKGPYVSERVALARRIDPILRA